MKFANTTFAARLLLLLVIIIILFTGYTLTSQNDSKAEEEAEKDPLTRYIERNDVYQGTDFTEVIASGRRGFQNRNYDYAKGKFKIAQALSSNHPVPYFFEAHCNFANQDYVGAYDALIQGFKFFPDWIRLSFDLSNEYMFPNNLIEQKNKLISKAADSEDFKTWFVLGYVLYYSGDLERSVIAFNEVIRIQNENKNADFATKIAEKFLIFLYDRGISSSPLVDESKKTLKSWKRKAIQHSNNKEYEKAVIVCGEEGMKFKNAEALFWMSLFLTADNSFEYSFSMLLRAASIDTEKIKEIPAINNVFDTDKLLEINNSAKSVRDKLLLSLFSGNQYAVLETLKSEDSQNFTQSEIDTLYEVLKFRDKLPKMPEIDENETIEKTDTPEKPLIEKTDDPDKPVNPDDSGNEIDLEELKKAEEFLKKELGKKISNALEFGKILFKEDKFKKAIEQFNLVLEYSNQISDEYLSQPENSEVYLLLSKSYFSLEMFDQASVNLQYYLNINGDLAKADNSLFFNDLKQNYFEKLYKQLDVYCTINENSYSSMFLKAYIDYFQDNSQSSADFFSSIYLNNSNDLAGWYLERLEDKNVKPTTSPKIKAKIHFLRAEKFLSEKIFEAAQVEYKKAYNNLNTEDNLKALTGLLVTLIYRASLTIGVQQRSDFYASASGYLRNYLEAIGEDSWKNFALDLIGKFPSKKDYESSLKMLESHLEARTLDFDAYYLLGFIHYFAKNYKDAHEAFEKFIRTKSQRDSLDVDYFMAVCENK